MHTDAIAAAPKIVEATGSSSQDSHAPQRRVRVAVAQAASEVLIAAISSDSLTGLVT